MRRAVCLLRSRRRTFLFSCGFSSVQKSCSACLYPYPMTQWYSSAPVGTSQEGLAGQGNPHWPQSTRNIISSPSGPAPALPKDKSKNGCWSSTAMFSCIIFSGKDVVVDVHRLDYSKNSGSPIGILGPSHYCGKHCERDHQIHFTLYVSTQIKPCVVLNLSKYKKVLLRELKRHTARRVASTRCAGLVGGTPAGGEVPHVGYPPPYQLDGVPPISWTGYPPLAGWGTPPPHQLDRVPPPPPRCELTDKLKTLPSPSFGCGR